MRYLPFKRVAVISLKSLNLWRETLRHVYMEEDSSCLRSSFHTVRCFRRKFCVAHCACAQAPNLFGAAVSACFVCPLSR